MPVWAWGIIWASPSIPYKTEWFNSELPKMNQQFQLVQLLIYQYCIQLKAAILPCSDQHHFVLKIDQLYLLLNIT